MPSEPLTIYTLTMSDSVSASYLVTRCRCAYLGPAEQSKFNEDNGYYAALRFHVTT